MHNLVELVYRVTDSAKFFYGVVVVFVMQTIWLAGTAIYPMPFDEYMHVGVIQIYARQWSPLITHQPVEASLYGDITRTGSYLYHYLMSFPYRVLDTFLDSQMALVIGLRCINIALVVAALVLFYKLFLLWKVPRRIINVVFLAFVFTPLVPFVATHVNYDNLILLITPAVLLFATRLIIDKGDVAWNGMLFVLFGLVGLLAKETFAPLLMIITLYVLWRLWREHDKRFWHSLVKSIGQNLHHFSFVLVLSGVLVLGGLAIERYGGNFVKYGSFLVECEAVQPQEVCEDFGPWYRDHVVNVQNRPAEPPYGNPFSFSQYWLTRMMRGYYVSFHHAPTEVVSAKEPFGPIIVKALLPVQVWAGTVALVAGLGAMVWQWRRILTQKPYRFMAVVCSFYVAVTWIFNYQSYLSIWKAEAIQARYTYPILLLLFVLLAQSINWTAGSKRLKALLVVALIPFYIWGGGVAGWSIRSDETWIWQQSIIQSLGRAVHEVFWHTVFH